MTGYCDCCNDTCSLIPLLHRISGQRLLLCAECYGFGIQAVAWARWIEGGPAPKINRDATRPSSDPS